MNPQSPESVLNALQWRYATKQFDPSQSIDPALWSQLEESLVLTPSSFGLQPWKFVVVTDQPKREALVAHSWGQRQVADCSHLLVLAVPTQITAEDAARLIQATASTRGIDPASLEGYQKMIEGFLQSLDAAALKNWAIRQTYIALGQFMLAASLAGVDTCPMEGFSAPHYDEILGLTALGLTTAVLCPAGYRAVEDKYRSLAKVRYPKEELLLHI